jgi:hypothetical protein
MKCCVCDRDWPDPKCRVIVLTAAEKKYVQSMGQEPPEQCIYCGPCWRVLSDRTQGAQLIKGAMQLQAQAQGIPNAEKLSQQFLSKLLELAKKPRS